MKRVLILTALLWLSAGLLMTVAQSGCSGPSMFARLVGGGPKLPSPETAGQYKAWGEGADYAVNPKMCGPPKPTLQDKFARGLSQFLDWPIRILFWLGIAVCICGFIPIVAALAPIFNLKVIGAAGAGIALLLYIAEMLIVMFFWPVVIGVAVCLLGVGIPFWIKGWHWAQRTSGVDLKFDGPDPKVQ